MSELTKAQKNVLRLIFVEKLTEEAALEKAVISARVYDGWFRQPLWSDEYYEKVKRCKRRADLIISSYQETAAVKLITLTDVDKDEVARKACLDILGMENEQKDTVKLEDKREMSPETQKAIMGIMESEDKNAD